MAYGKITSKQQEILDFIKSEILRKGYPPAVRDICEAVHLKSTSSVHSHLESLERNGYIRRDPTKPRAIEIMDENFYMLRHEVVNVPLVPWLPVNRFWPRRILNLIFRFRRNMYRIRIRLCSG